MSNPTLNADALCTAEEVKQYLSMEDFDDNIDDLITATINRKSTQILNYIDLPIASTTYTEYHDGNSSQELYPNMYPITSVSGIWNDSSWGWSDSNLVDSTTYMIVDDNRIVLKSGNFGTGTRNVKITYVAGYASTPEDIKAACIKEIVREVRQRDRLGITAMTEDRAVGSFDANYVLDTFLPDNLKVLNRYKRKAAW